MILRRGLALLVFTIAGAVFAQDSALPTRALLRIGTTKLRHGSRILSLAYSPNGQMLAAGGGHDPVRLWNPKTGELIREITEHDVTALTFTESGRTLLMAGYQKHIRFFDVLTNKETGRLEGHKAAIKSVAVSPDTTTIASGSQDGLVYLWEWNSKRKIDELKGHTDEVTAVAFSVDSVLASAGSDRTIRLWAIENDRYKLKQTLDAGCGVYCLTFAADGSTLYAAGDDYLIRRWEVTTGKQTGVFKGHEGIIVSLIAQGDSVISGALDRTVRFWDAKSTELRKTLPRRQGDCDALAVTRAGDFLALAGLNNTIRILDVAKGAEVTLDSGPQSGLATLALSPAQRLASISSDGQIMVLDALTGKTLRQWDSRHTGETTLQFTSAGKLLVSASNLVRVWNADDGAALGEFANNPGDPVVATACSPDGKTLALGLRSARIELWEVAAKKLIGTMQYEGSLYALAWSPDGKKLASGGGAKVLIWDPESRGVIQSFDVKEGPAPPFPMVATLAFGPESKTLAAGCFDAHIRIYNLSAKNPTNEKELRLCEGHLAVPYGIAFAPDGRTLVSGSFDRTVRLWEAFSGKQIANFKGHFGAVMGVAFARDGRSVYSAATDTTIVQWDVPGIGEKGKLPVVALEHADLESAWLELKEEDTPRGHQAMWRCIAFGARTIAHLTKQKKYHLEEPERVKKLFKDLDSGNFIVRTAAMKELMEKGRWMEGRYDAAIANPPSLEYKRRVEILKENLQKSDTPSIAQERLRLRRFMLICEQIGGPEAIEALQNIADRGPEEDLRDEAKGSLQRLKK